MDDESLPDMAVWINETRDKKSEESNLGKNLKVWSEEKPPGRWWFAIAAASGCKKRLITSQNNLKKDVLYTITRTSFKNEMWSGFEL